MFSLLAAAGMLVLLVASAGLFTLWLILRVVFLPVRLAVALVRTVLGFVLALGAGLFVTAGIGIVGVVLLAILALPLFVLVLLVWAARRLFFPPAIA